jgi:hypothetical protein
MANTKITDTNAFAQDAKNRLHVLRQEIINSVPNIEDGRFQALLETSSEVLDGLERAFDHYSRKSEAAWK